MDRSLTGNKGNETVNTIQHGWDVEDNNGNKVGDVAEVAGTYIVVSQGWLFPTERYVPRSALREVRDNKVFLTVSKDEIDQRGWDQPPLTSTTAPAGTTRDQSGSSVSADQFETPGNKYAANQLTVPDESSNPDWEEGSTAGQPTTEEV
ncbi:MAG TPA: DUF2171 domain-containing protein [Thermomicrobiaceae bacterium]|nr:DUF2171 domain-containing protein [Thermomicrobiaceae bacterium]